VKSSSDLKEVKVKTVEKSLKLLEILAGQNTSLPLTKLGEMSKLSLSTAHRLLATLCRSGFVERDRFTGHYKLGLKAFLIGNAALQSIDLRSAALPYLTGLMEQSGETTYLAILANKDLIYSDSVKNQGLMQIGVQTGVSAPACQTSSGKVLMAYLAPADLRTMIEYFVQKQLIADAEEFINSLRHIKRNGYFVGITGLGGNIHEISAPVFNHVRLCIGAISIFSASFGGAANSERRLAELVRQTAWEISKAMGAPVDELKIGEAAIS